MEKIEIRQVRSTIKRPKDQKLTMQALGLRGINSTIVKEKTDSIAGMVNKVSHLIEIKEVK
ncbi:MAG: 50S ribosomal protein L30 [Bacteroidota bacterium]